MPTTLNFTQGAPVALVRARRGRAPRAPRPRPVTTAHAEGQPVKGTTPSRRAALARGAALGMATLGIGDLTLEQPSIAGGQAAPGFFLYERGSRERFETSISSALRPYSLEVPNGWSEGVVSLNDGKLYGIDLRFSNEKEGQLAVSVLPYANRDSITEAGTPDEALNTFLELVGAFWDENGFGDVGKINSVLKADKLEKGGQVYYSYELKSPNSLILANATDGQLYILNVSAKRLQWKNSEELLRRIVNTFNVPK